MIAGHVSIAPRALEGVARGVAAGHLGVEAARVTVRLGDEGGQLAVAVSAPLRSAPLGAATAAPGIATRSEEARTGIARDVAALSGAVVRGVALTITGIEIERGPRVS